jgi:hypothetical protein
MGDMGTKFIGKQVLFHQIALGFILE